MTRALSLLLSAAGGLALMTSPVSAQSDRPQDRRNPPPVTWCEKPVPKPKWKRQSVSFTLEIHPADTAAEQRRLLPYLPFLLSGIAERYIAEHQPMRDIKAEKSKTLPPGEPRYGPVDLNAKVLFELVGDGSVDSISIPPTAFSFLAADLEAALRTASARGDVFGPYADPSVRTRLRLVAELTDLPSMSVSWPAFTLYAPVNKPARADARNTVGGYPADALGWNGKLLFQYMIDESGRVVPNSAAVVGADKLVWKSDGHRQAYENFKRQVETALPRMRFFPAEVNGCFVKTMVVQEFAFTMNN